MGVSWGNLDDNDDDKIVMVIFGIVGLNGEYLNFLF